MSGEPPFEATVGYRRNKMKQYGARRNSLSVRVFLSEANGLVLRASTRAPPCVVDWTARLDDKTLASGTMKKSYYVRTAPIDADKIPRLSFHLRIGIMNRHSN